MPVLIILHIPISHKRGHPDPFGKPPLRALEGAQGRSIEGSRGAVLGSILAQMLRYGPHHAQVGEGAFPGAGVRQMCESSHERFFGHGVCLISGKSDAKTIHPMPVYTTHRIGRMSGASQLFPCPFWPLPRTVFHRSFSSNPSHHSAAYGVPEGGMPLLMKIPASSHPTPIRDWRVRPHGLP